MSKIPAWQQLALLELKELDAVIISNSLGMARAHDKSIELGNETVAFPDFTGGQWMFRKSRFALGDDY